MLVPEIVILKTVNSFIAYVAEDYLTASDKADTVLHAIFNEDDNDDKMAFSSKDNLLKAAVAMFTATNDNVDRLTVTIGYNRERAELGLPSLHILLPTETKGRMDTIGNSEKNIYKDGVVYTDAAKSKTAVYHLMITSKNVEEILVVYYFLQATFLMFNFHCEAAGMRNLKSSGADINMQTDFSLPIYHRNCTIEFDYEYHLKLKLRETLVSKFNLRVCADLADENNAFYQ